MTARPVSFTAVLQKFPGKGGWTYVAIPPDATPRESGAWGRTPATANVDGRTWVTSVWREKSGRCMLPVPKKIRPDKSAGDTVTVALAYPAPLRG